MPRDAQVLFDWQVSSYFGWGLYGLNLIQAWADRTDILPTSLQPQGRIFIDPLESIRIDPALRRGVKAQTELKALSKGGTYRSGSLLLKGMGNNLMGSLVGDQVALEGSPSVGIVFMEKTTLTPDAAVRLRELPLIIAGSSWNQQLLRDLGAPRAELVIQGIDTSQFHPAPKRSLFKDRFVVFSGGKLEYRKGQDQVVRAFRIFAERHKDALLLTAWGSAWPELARDLGAGDGMIPPPFLADGTFSPHGWTLSNGIPERQVVHCGSLPNYLMPRIVREADVAIFPNRAEGGTNLVAMECMACAIPTIVSANTGHLDLLEDGTAFALRQQTPLPGDEVKEWGNSDIEEMVEALETVYNGREAAVARAQEGAANLSSLTWAAQMDKLGALLLPLMPNA